MDLPFFGGSLIGIQYMDGILRVAVTKFAHRKEGVRKVCEIEVSTKMLSADGVIRMPKEVGQIIRSHLQQAHLRGHSGKAAVLVAPEKVYTHYFTSPPVNKDAMTKLLKLEVSKIVPEEYDDLLIIHRVLTQTPERMEVGVAGVRMDILNGYLESAKEANLQGDRITTLPCAIASFTHAQKETTTFLLLIPPTDKKKGSLTLFHHGWPVDEAMLRIGVPMESVIETIQSLSHEAAQRGFNVERLVYLGSQAAQDELQKAFAPGASADPNAPPPLPLERALPWLKDDTEWGGLQTICLAPKQKILLNFAPSVKSSKAMSGDGKSTGKQVAIAAGLGVVLLGIIAYIAIAMF